MSGPLDLSDESPACYGSVAASGVDSRPRFVVALFATALFTSAFLMFVVEPMIARMVLPMLGGAPAVWNTCLVFFQTMLLAGYAYAHGAARYLGIRRHIVVHAALIVLPLLAMPVGLHGAPPDSSQSPVGWLLLTLVGSIGLPFFVLSTSAAVLQKWFSVTDDEAAGDPYFLYTASNLGSFVALLAYPAVIEPTFRLRDQAEWWTIGYVAFAALTLGCAAVVWRRGPADGAATRRPVASVDEAPTWPRRGRWIALAFVPSSLLLAVTNYISTDVASVPLLWILPLSLYLLTFVVAFSPRATQVRTLAARAVPMLVILLTVVLIADMTSPLAYVIPLHLLAFFAIAISCHADLAADRPSAGRLTEFYFWLSLGGMLGGLFNALLAPVIFDGIIEYPLVLVVACALRRASSPATGRKLVRADLAVPLCIGLAVAASVLVNNRFGSLSRFIMIGAALPAFAAFSQKRHVFRFAASVAAILIAGTLVESLFGRVVFAERTFYGVNRVRVDEALGYRFIFHGTTLHGMQSLDPNRRGEPLSYFHRSGPVGQVFAQVPQAAAAQKVAVIGLGVGTLASYRLPGQQWTYYEIDPVVEQIARNDDYFTYLADCGSHCTVITGDGRVSLGRAEPHTYGLILLDAFSSDAVPIHLMTREAFSLYVSRLAPDGLIVFHISNVHLSFSGLLARLAADVGLHALWQKEPADAGSWKLGKFPSEWFVMARDRQHFGHLVHDPRWKIPPVPAGTPLWTDDFSNILSALR